MTKTPPLPSGRTAQLSKAQPIIGEFIGTKFKFFMKKNLILNSSAGNKVNTFINQTTSRA